jgi:TusA-related sulfurtransferase
MSYAKMTQGLTQGLAADYEIDITSDICPMTYVRTRLALERLAPGQVLAVMLRGPDPLRNVPLSATRQGHIVLGQETLGDGIVRLLIRRQ